MAFAKYSVKSGPEMISRKRSFIIKSEIFRNSLFRFKIISSVTTIFNFNFPDFAVFVLAEPGTGEIPRQEENPKKKRKNKIN